MSSESSLKKQSRSSWQITKSVWWALLIREALSRTMSDRLGWFWLFAQPVLIVIVMVSIRTVVLGRMRTISGAEFVPWLIIGLLGFQLFRETMMRSMGAVEANRQLFSYRQVMCIDPVFVRCYVEGLLATFVLLIFVFVTLLFDFSLVPHDSVMALYSWFSLWFLGVGGGLVISVSATLLPETKKIVPVLMMPLLLLSGVIFPINYLPPVYQEYFLLNPIVHGLELFRGYTFEAYQPLKEVSFYYLWLWSLSLVTLGLMLHIRFQHRLKVL